MSQLRKNLVYFSLEDWDEIWRRNQFICKALLQRNSELHILWVSLSLDLFGKAPMSARMLALRGKPYTPDQYERLSVIKPLKLLPNVIGKPINEAVTLQKVVSSLQQLGMAEYDMIVNDPLMNWITTRLKSGKLIYDITDDWNLASRSPRIHSRIVDADAELLRKADFVVACSENIRQAKSANRSDIVLIHNGVDADIYHPTRLAQLALPADVSCIPEPRIMYIGTLHDDRLDVALASEIASRLPAFSFVFVGPNLLKTADLKSLNKPNVHLLGPRNHSEIPQYASGAAAFVITHKVNGFTNSLDPLKLYEYLATGKPVVSTPSDRLQGLEHLVSIAGASADFAEQLQVAIKKGSDEAQVAARIAYAADFSWESAACRFERLFGWQ